MRLRKIPGAEEEIAASRYNIANPKDNKGKWKDIFANANPIYIEIGMGKGDFIIQNAIKNPNKNYIGIEKFPSVLLRAVQKLEELEELSNLRLICMDAEEIEDVFANEEVAKIYLNFSDPWPKERHAKRRLTSKAFLDRYDKVLEKNGVIEFKTDNVKLFEFTIEEVDNSKWVKDQVTFDLHHTPSMLEGNIMTEYEKKFVALNNKICKIIISR